MTMAGEISQKLGFVLHRNIHEINARACHLLKKNSRKNREIHPAHTPHGPQKSQPKMVLFLLSRGTSDRFVPWMSDSCSVV